MIRHEITHLLNQVSDISYGARLLSTPLPTPCRGQLESARDRIDEIIQRDKEMTNGNENHD